MSDFSFLAVPNIEGMRLGWYIQIFGIVIFFGVCLFFVLYFWLKYHRKQTLTHQLQDFDQQAQHLGKQLLIQNIKKASGKTKLILFIEYLERFITTKAYANLSELLSSQGFTLEEIKECEQVIYADKKFSKQVTDMLDNYFIS